MWKKQQSGRGAWTVRSAWSLPLVAAALVAGAVPAVGQSVETRLDLDERQLDRLYAASDAQNVDLQNILLPDILENALTLSYESERPRALVVFAFAIKEGRTIGEFQSRAVIFRIGQKTGLAEDYLPADRFYDALEIDRRRIGSGGGAGKVSQKEMLRPSGAVSGERVLRDPAGVASRLYPGSDWREHVAVFLVAVPADVELRQEAQAYPSPLFIPALDGSSK